MTANELKNNNNYHLIKTIKYNEVVPFVMKQIKKPTPTTLLFLLFNGLIIVMFLFMLLQNIFTGYLEWGKILTHIMWGTLLSFTAVIPLHEAIHAIVYRFMGARNIKVGAKLHQMIFYITADHFVINKNKFSYVALAPFLLINLSYIAGIYFFGPYGDFLFMTSLVFHSMNCLGDFALLSYFRSFKNDVYTFDDTSKEVSYFYEKISE